MSVFLTLLIKIVPLYTSIALGYLAGRKLHVDKASVANLVLYIFNPIIIFGFIMQAEIEWQHLILPVLAVAFCAIMGVLSYWIAGLKWKDKSKNLISHTVSTGNTGYFGVPIGLMLFEPHVLGLYMLISIGDAIYQNTGAYYILARGKFSAKESFKKLIRFPMIYAAIFAIVFNMMHFEIPSVFVSTVEGFKNSYAILGMMIIGLALSELKEFKLDWSMIVLTNVMRFLVWPLLIFGFIGLDKHVFGLFDPEIYPMFILYAFVPMAANATAFATMLDVYPEKAAAMVLSSTLLALIAIPAAYVLFMS